MVGPKLRILSAIALACLACLLSVVAVKTTATSGDDMSANVKTARQALEKYHDPIAAVRDGYFSTLACIDFPKSGKLAGMDYPAGGMGVHFINPRLIGTKLDYAHPQVLMYEPVADKLELVAAEWFVPYGPGVTRPELFGHQFYGPMMGHYPVMPAQFTHYDLHVWLWKDNPAGMFVPTNANVKCPAGGYTYHDDTPMMPMMTGH